MFQGAREVLDSLLRGLDRGDVNAIASYLPRRLCAQDREAGLDLPGSATRSYGAITIGRVQMHPIRYAVPIRSLV